MTRGTILCPGTSIRLFAGVCTRFWAALIPVAFFLVLLSNCGAALTAGPIRVEDSSRGSLRISLDAGDLNWRTHELRGGALVLQQPELPGFASTGEPARPLLPTAGAWVVIPPGTRPVLRRIAAEWETLDGRRLMVAATPVFQRRDGESVLESEFLMPGEKPRTGDAVAVERVGSAPTAGEPMVIGDPAPWRGRRIAPLTISPVVADESGAARRFLRSGEWEIEFVRDPDSSPAGGMVVPDDSRFSYLFINGEALATWPREGGDAGREPMVEAEPGPRPAPGPLLQPEVRLPVTRSRLHEVRATTLRAAGLLTAMDVDEDQIRLYQRRYDPLSASGYREIEIPIELIGDGGSFSDGESFIFYGLRPRDDGSYIDGDGVEQPGCGDPDEAYNPSEADDVNGGNIYYLAFLDPDAGTPWARFGSQELSAAAGPPLASYRRIDTFEEDLKYTIYPHISQPDHYHWNGTFDSSAVVEFPVWSPVASATDDTVTVGVGGGPTLLCVLESDAGTDTLGYVEAGAGGSSLVASGITGDQLSGAGLTLKVSRPGSSFILGYLDWFSVSYEAEFTALGDELEFTGGGGAGPQSLEVAGFTNPDINLYEITDLRRPVRVDLTAANVVADGDGWKLSLGYDQNDQIRRFWAHAGPLADAVPDLSTFRFSRVEEPGDLLAQAVAPDVLVVVHPDFRSSLQPWIDHRRARAGGDLEFLVADVHSVYDQFSGGMKTPDAIKRFVQAAIERPGWSPWSLMLVGDANENVRNMRAPADQKDWVPSRMHVWSYGSYANELLPSDKWYANSSASVSYPNDSYTPPELMVGRFPCNSAAELADMIDKVITFETASGAADWKRRAVFLADDQWSSGYSVQDLNTVLTSTEAAFENTEEIGAAGWDTLAANGLETVRVYLSDYLDPLVSPPDTTERDDKTFRGYARDYITLPVLLPELSAGAALFHYQGHANSYLLAHEHVIEDMVGISSLRQDASSMANTGKPFVFMGLGCHIAAWALDAAERSNSQTPSLGEKMLRKPGAGACAVYASPGYEFLQSNADLVSLQFDAWFNRPVRSGDPARSRWMLGEMLMQAESEFLAAASYLLNNRRLVAQYHLLGDPLMVVDCGSPQAEVRIDGRELSDGDELVAADAANILQLGVEAWDEAGIDRIEVRDSAGADFGAVATGGTPAGAASDQYAAWTVDLPVRPFDHEVLVEIFDTADLPADDHYVLALGLSQEFDLYLDGLPVSEGEVEFMADLPLAFTGDVSTAAWIADDAEMELDGRNLDLSGVLLERTDPHVIDISFTAAVSEDAVAGQGLAVILKVDGYETEYVLSSEDVEPVTELVSLPQAFPNPLRDGTRFIFKTGIDWNGGKLVLFSVAGRRVAEVPVPAGAKGDVIVPWNGRDRAGDRLANGVYLYRVELDTALGAVSSGMQRLVVMR